MSELKQRITEDMKTAMKAHEKERLGVIRLIQAALKQKEVDERIELTDTDVLAILDKMVKQRKDSIEQFEAANRQELADKEKYEISVIQNYLPQALTTDEINTLIAAAITASGAKAMADMGKVMAILKPQLQGRADLGAVSKQIKDKLS